MIHNPAALYTGGAERFNSQPEVNLYANVLAKQQAKNEAMDAYERSRINSVNEAGLRDIDRKALDDKLGDIRSFYNRNKDRIKRGNSQEAFDYEKKFRDVKDLIAGSKERNARHNAALAFYNDRLKQDQRLPDDFMVELSSNDKAIGETYVDPTTGEKREYEPFNLTKWSSEAKPFVQDKYVKGFADIKRTANAPRYEAIAGQPLKQTEIIEEVFDPAAKQVIAARAADRYDNSYSFANQVQSDIKDPVRRKKLSDLFKQEYGTEPTMPSDYAIAYTMELLQPKVAKTKAVDNKSAIMDRNEAFKIKMEGIRDANIKSRASMNQQKAGLADYDVFGNYTNKMKPMVVKGEKSANGWGADDKEIVIIPYNSIDVNDKKLMGEVKPVSNEKGEKYIIVREDGDWEGAGGQIISRVNTARKNMDATSMNEVGRGRLSKDLVPKTNTPPASTTPTYKKADLLKNGWTEDQINQAQKAGRIKVN